MGFFFNLHFYDILETSNQLIYLILRFQVTGSWRRNAWRGDLSRRIPSSNLSANRRTDFPPDTPVSTSGSRGSRNRVLAIKRSRQRGCNSPRDSLDHHRVCLPIPMLDMSHNQQIAKGNVGGKPHGDMSHNKQIHKGDVQQIFCFHSL
ncbi:hypothetical protein ElyMa_005543200 [Elysia marginata]|uniref:Uncharacterized protein n=1 Tax=Elysia marginata TaxID=1093978 RepID=A0AAV4EY69_9GAST|nr:hypothetical protein ElyMa_005543200 [Elysia marginata]